jgi:Domain of unknown function (DUF4192)
MFMVNRKPAHVRVSSVSDVLAVIPRLFGYQPDDSLVFLAISRGQVTVTGRLDLPDRDDAVAVAEHLAGLLAGDHAEATVILIGYGPGRAVTPVMDAARSALSRADIPVADALRVQEGRYWSYLCTEPGCCPVDVASANFGVHAAMEAAGLPPALPARADRVATLAPLIGEDARLSQAATKAAEQYYRRLARAGKDKALAAGLAETGRAIAAYRHGRPIVAERYAWLSVAASFLPVRDDAWARMDPEHCRAHLRLWTDVLRRAQPRYVPAIASLLALTAWQCGDGTLANVAIERALAADPAYSMALLLREAVSAMLPPSVARPPMTPEEVAESYRTA